jgi:hypothetical protein
VSPAFSRVAAAFVFGEDRHGELSREEMLALAFFGRAVSPVTSYLAIEPGVRPSRIGIVGRGEGSGTGAGFGAGSGRMGGGRTPPNLAAAAGRQAGGAMVAWYDGRWANSSSHDESCGRRSRQAIWPKRRSR